MLKRSHVHAGGAQDGGVEGVDRALAVELGEAAGLERAVAVAQQHDRPVRAVGVLLVGVVAGVNDERVVHHRAAAFGHAFQLLHQLHQHAAVVLADLDPDRIVRLRHVAEVVALLLDAEALPRAEDLAPAGADREHAGDAGLERRDAEVEERGRASRSRTRAGCSGSSTFGCELPQVIGDLAEPLAQAVDVAEALDELAVALRLGRRAALCPWRRPVARCGRACCERRLVLAADVALRDAAVEHLVKVVRVRVHEDRLARAAARKGSPPWAWPSCFPWSPCRCRGGAGGFREAPCSARSRSSAPLGGDPVAATIAAERAEEGAVGGAGVQAVEAVDDVHALLERLQRLDRLRQHRLRQGTAVGHARRECRSPDRSPGSGGRR